MYNYKDELKQGGKYYYRLKLISANGSVQYSKVNAIHFYNYSKLQISPNPAVHQIIVRNAHKNNGIILYNSSGHQVNAVVQWLDEKTAKVTIAPLPRGFYYLQNSTIVEPFIKE